MTTQPAAVRAWHTVASTKDPAGLDVLLADDVVFRSPAVHGDQAGKALTAWYLSAAVVVLGPTLRYVHEWYDADSAVLEFEAEVDGRQVHGVDMLRWNDSDQLVSFTVMVRPMRGLEAVVAAMRAQLEATAPGAHG